MAVMLGTLRMDVDACITECRDMAPEIFPVENTFGQSALGKSIKLVRGKDRFDPRPLESAIKRLVKKYLGDEAIASEDNPFRFRPSNIGGQDNCRV